jgi:hypothetical protein
MPRNHSRLKGRMVSLNLSDRVQKESAWSTICSEKNIDKCSQGAVSLDGENLGVSSSFPFIFLKHTPYSTWDCFHL